MSTIQSPSTLFRQWLTAQLDAVAPGAQLPADREIAQLLGISLSSVRRCMREFVDNKSIMRIQGKGSFKPGGVEPPDPQPRRSSAQRLADEIGALITGGRLKTGAYLPSITGMAHQYHLRATTVIEAYRLLEKRDLVRKIGRRYRIGTFTAAVLPRRPKEVIIYNYSGRDFAYWFRRSRMSPALCTMEQELITHGFVIRHFFDGREFPAHQARWHVERRYPACLIMLGLDRKNYTAVMKANERIRHRSDTRLLLIAPRTVPDKLTTMHCLLRGNVFTVFCRTLARFIATTQHPRGLLFYDMTDPHNRRTLGGHLKLWTELMHISPRFRLKIVIKPDRPTASDHKDLLVRVTSFDEAHVQALISKYVPTPLRGITGDVIVTGSFEEIFKQHRSGSVWIFSTDGRAARALHWACSHAIRVPEEVSIIGLENDPAYYHLGITTVKEDWDTIGYQLAHALIGDFPVARTRHGFIQTDALVLERLTTLRNASR